MELRHLRYFAAVAQHLNYTQASRQLHVAQPAISQSILDLEDELGLKLLSRSKRHVQLTAAGSAFLPEATEILRRADEAKRVAQRAARGEIGRIEVAFLGPGAGPFLPSVIRAYLQQYPDVELHLTEMMPDQQLEALESGGIDVGFSSPFPEQTRDWLDSELIFTDQLVLALPREHPLAARARVNLRDVATEDFVQFHRRGAPNLFDACVAMCGHAGFAPRIVNEASIMDTVLTLVESGLGVSLVPACVRHLRRQDCVLRPVRPKSPRIEIRMIWRRDSPSPSLAALREVVLSRRADIQAQMQM